MSIPIAVDWSNEQGHVPGVLYVYVSPIFVIFIDGNPFLVNVQLCVGTRLKDVTLVPIEC